MFDTKSDEFRASLNALSTNELWDLITTAQDIIRKRNGVFTKYESSSPAKNAFINNEHIHDNTLEYIGEHTGMRDTSALILESKEPVLGKKTGALNSEINRNQSNKRVKNDPMGQLKRKLQEISEHNVEEKSSKKKLSSKEVLPDETLPFPEKLADEYLEPYLEERRYLNTHTVDSKNLAADVPENDSQEAQIIGTESHKTWFDNKDFPPAGFTKNDIKNSNPTKNCFQKVDSGKIKAQKVDSTYETDKPVPEMMSAPVILGAKTTRTQETEFRKPKSIPPYANFDREIRVNSKEAIYFPPIQIVDELLDSMEKEQLQTIIDKENQRTMNLEKFVNYYTETYIEKLVSTRRLPKHFRLSLHYNPVRLKPWRIQDFKLNESSKYSIKKELKKTRKYWEQKNIVNDEFTDSYYNHFYKFFDNLKNVENPLQLNERIAYPSTQELNEDKYYMQIHEYNTCKKMLLLAVNHTIPQEERGYLFRNKMLNNLVDFGLFNLDFDLMLISFRKEIEEYEKRNLPGGAESP